MEIKVRDININGILGSLLVQEETFQKGWEEGAEYILNATCDLISFTDTFKLINKLNGYNLPNQYLVMAENLYSNLVYDGADMASMHENIDEILSTFKNLIEIKGV